MELGNVDETKRCHTAALARVGDKWSIRLVMQLEAGPLRFNELSRAIAGISPKMLAQTLRGLERDGFLTRTVYPHKPPHVEYALSGLGREMLTPVKALGGWVMDNLHQIESSRSRFDDGNV